MHSTILESQILSTILIFLMDENLKSITSIQSVKFIFGWAFKEKKIIYMTDFNKL